MVQVIKIEPFNTNNGWGFGGSYGKRYIYDNGYVKVVGRYCYRHTGTSPRNEFYNDKGEAITKKQFLESINKEAV